MAESLPQPTDALAAAQAIADSLAPALRDAQAIANSLARAHDRAVESMGTGRTFNANVTLWVLGAGPLCRQLGLSPEHDDIFDLARALDARPEILGSVTVAGAGLHRPRAVRIGTGLGSGYVGQDGAPAGRRVEVIAALLPADVRRKTWRAWSFSEIPGGGPRRSTRAANAARMLGREDPETEHVEIAADTAPSAEDHVLAEDRKRSGLLRLRCVATDAQRAILDAMESEPGLTSSEIARRIGKSPANVRVQMKRLRDWAAGK